MSTFFANHFHWYGFLIGCAVCVSMWLIEKKLRDLQLPEKFQQRLFVCGCAGGIIGARAYHVLTDWPLYQSYFIRAFEIWRGGLSIIGAVMGVMIGVWIFLYFFDRRKKTLSFWQAADALVFGLPFGQAIGRMGNYVNQELYGLPTNLPWKIFIDPAHRLPQFADVQFFHPLFAYEMIGDMCIGCLLWWCARKKIWQVGEGKFFLLYVMIYATLRVALDFLRPDKSLFLGSLFGVNQVILSGVLFGACAFFTKKIWRKK
jgi:phosphatidylglycerol:prolipoprotein diacylglycerol transferase